MLEVVVLGLLLVLVLRRLQLLLPLLVPLLLLLPPLCVAIHYHWSPTASFDVVMWIPRDSNWRPSAP
jgi:hypothetical protein